MVDGVRGEQAAAGHFEPAVREQPDGALVEDRVALAVGVDDCRLVLADEPRQGVLDCLIPDGLGGNDRAGSSGAASKSLRAV